MLRWLKAVLEWIFGHESSLIQLSLQSPEHKGVSRGRRQGPDSRQGGGDFDSRMREPKWLSPAGRSGSVAVPEPDDEEGAVLAIWRSNSRIANGRRTNPEG
jgi:hypothetical protein